jgi:hypothetical protein
LRSVEPANEKLKDMGTTQRLTFRTSDLIAKIEQKISAGADTHSSILLAEWLARFLFSNYCGIYTLARVENALVSRFDLVAFAGQRKAVLHVATELYAHGGHTRLMKNLVGAVDCTMRQTAITRATERNDIAHLLDIPPEEVRVFAETDEARKVVALAMYFVQFERLVLHLHPDDVTAAVAVGLAKKSFPHLKVFFVNHSDHTFSSAIASADCVLEISAYGLSLAEARGVAGRGSFIGIPIAPAGAKDQSLRTAGLVLTGGSAYKFRPDGHGGLASAFAALLSADKSLSIVAIGPRKGDYWWWPLKLRFPGRFRSIARVPYMEYLRLLSSCSLYVDSYPVTGGTAFTEALMGGAKVSGRTGGPNGYGMADKLRRNGEPLFVEHCLKLLGNDAAALLEQEQIRGQAVAFHSLGAVQKRFQTSLFDDAVHAPPSVLREAAFDFDFRSNWIATGRMVAVGFRTMAQIRLLPELASIFIKAGADPRFLAGVYLRAAVAWLRLRRAKVTG